MGETDRVRVPTNGHRPALGTADDEAEAARPATTASGDALADAATGPDLRIAVTPGQLAAGFGILAGLILLFVGSRRRGQDRDRQG